MKHSDLSPSLNALSKQVIEAALWIHGRLGPGLLEKTYRTFLAAELTRRGMRAMERVRVKVALDDLVVEQALEIDILVNDVLVIETKATSAIHPIHVAQTLTYLRMTGLELGLVLNFNTFPIGIRRVVLTDPPVFADFANFAANPEVGEGGASAPSTTKGGSP